MSDQQQSTFKEPETVPTQETVLPPSSSASSTVEQESPTFNPPQQAPAQQQQNQPQESQFIKDAKEMIVNISQDSYNQILKSFKDGTLRFEYVDNSGHVKQDNRSYVPMTIGQNKKALKVSKKVRLLTQDIQAFRNNEEGALTVEELIKKYPDILEEDIDENDLKNQLTLNEIMGTYITAQKAKIYWNIEDIENYTAQNLVILTSLYESRNGFSPS